MIGDLIILIGTVLLIIALVLNFLEFTRSNWREEAQIRYHSQELVIALGIIAGALSQGQSITAIIWIAIAWYAKYKLNKAINEQTKKAKEQRQGLR